MTESYWHNQDTVLGKLVVEHGLATPQDVHDCQAFQRELQSRNTTVDHRSLAELLVANGIMTQRQLDRLAKLPGYQPQNAQMIPGFRIIHDKKLGVGGMATVYLAKQLSLDRMVAIKLLPRKHTDNPQFVARFYAEGRAAAKLNHPNIVGALDVGKAGDCHYFVMEYVQGRTVLDDLRSRTRYDEREAIGITIQIARALNHAHKNGLIHRDVKPKNIIITPDGIAKLADMGLARSLSDREGAEAELGKAFGTPYYISPEQIRGDLDIDFRADIYCLGATFYHMVTGRVPFEGPNPSAVMHKHLKSDLVPPDHINPDLSLGVKEIIEVCMAKNRNHRYNDTASLLADLEAVNAGDPPVFARTQFDLALLADLEATGELRPPVGTQKAHSDGFPLFAHPVFWLAIIGWAAALVLLATLLSTTS